MFIDFDKIKINLINRIYSSKQKFPPINKYVEQILSDIKQSNKEN